VGQERAFGLLPANAAFHESTHTGGRRQRPGHASAGGENSQLSSLKPWPRSRSLRVRGLGLELHSGKPLGVDISLTSIDPYVL